MADLSLGLRFVGVVMVIESPSAQSPHHSIVGVQMIKQKALQDIVGSNVFRERQQGLQCYFVEL